MKTSLFFIILWTIFLTANLTLAIIGGYWYSILATLLSAAFLQWNCTNLIKEYKKEK